MTTKEYLSRVQKLEYKIGRMKLRAKEYELLSQSLPGQSYDGVRVDGTRNTDAPFVKWLMKKCDLEREIEALEEKLVNIKAEIMLCIESLDNEDYKNVLMLHYIESIGWREIAERLYVSEATIFRWHRQGLSEIVIPKKDDS